MSTARDHLMAKHRDELAAWRETQMDQQVLSEDEYDSEQRTQWLEGARFYDSGASLAEEFVLRLRGDAAQSGGLDLTVGGALLKPLQEMIASAAQRDVKLLLVGISPGSTVLHFQPEADLSPVEDTDSPAGLSIDTAVHRIIDLVDAAESATQPERWGATEKGLGDLARVLARFDLTADLRWMDPAGGVKTSSLTQHGRDNVLRWHAEVPTTPPPRLEISGRISELREPACVAKVKTGNTKKAKAYEVHFEPGQLIGLRLTLGLQVAFTIEERTRLTRNGQAIAEYYFVSWDNRPQRVTE